MQNKDVLGHSFCSFFLVNRKFELLLFSIDPFTDLNKFILNKPTIGGNIEKIVSQSYRRQFLRLIVKCFEGDCFNIILKNKAEESLSLPYSIVFTPIFKDNERCVACTFVNSEEAVDHLNLISYFHNSSSHLRTSATHILSQFSNMGYAEAKSYDMLKINSLLSDVSLQTKKLDNIITKLYLLLVQNECLNQN